jgi:hypothetical protein
MPLEPLIALGCVIITISIWGRSTRPPWVLDSPPPKTYTGKPVTQLSILSVRWRKETWPSNYHPDRVGHYTFDAWYPIPPGVEDFGTWLDRQSERPL